MRTVGTDYAVVGRLLANPARSAMVDALMEGRRLAAGELARIAGVSPSSASEHLAALVAGGLVVAEAHGRHRYYAIASSEIAEALESLGNICPTTPVRSLRASIQAEHPSFARTCYDHLAGRLCVALLRRLLDRAWLVPGGDGYRLTAAGDEGMAALGIDVARAAARRRAFARPCLDWTERRPHLAGALGAALTMALLDRGWLAPDTPARGLVVTGAGRAGLAAAFAIDPDAADACREPTPGGAVRRRDAAHAGARPRRR